MPDIIDSTVGILFNGIFKHWYGHSLVGVFTIDLLGGLLIAWMITVFVAGLLKYCPLTTTFAGAFHKRTAEKRVGG